MYLLIIASFYSYSMVMASLQFIYSKLIVTQAISYHLDYFIRIYSENKITSGSYMNIFHGLLSFKVANVIFVMFLFTNWSQTIQQIILKNENKNKKTLCR